MLLLSSLPALPAPRLPVSWHGAFHPILLRHRAHEQVGDEADDEQAGHDVQNDGVALLLGDVIGDVVVEDPVDDERADDSGSRPGCEQASMNGADVVCAEEIF